MIMAKSNRGEIANRIRSDEVLTKKPDEDGEEEKKSSRVVFYIVNCLLQRIMEGTVGANQT